MKTVISSIRMRLVGISALLLAGVLFTSCNKNNDDINETPNNDAAALMAFNLVPDRNSIGITISGNNITPNPLGYTSYTGTYLSIFPGSRVIESYDNNGIIATSPAFQFDSSRYYSAFVAGANGSFRNIIVEDNFDGLSGASGQAYVRYINAIPDSARPTVAISAAGVNDQPAFGSVSAFKAVTPGDIVVDINNGGTIDVDRTIQVEARKVYTILLVGQPGSGTNAPAIRFIANGQLDESDQRVVAPGNARQANLN